MTAFVVDANVWLAAVNADAASHEAARALLDAAAEDEVGLTLCTLDLTLYEVVNAAVVLWKSTSAAEHVAELVHVTCAGDLRLVDESLLRHAADLATRHDLTIYDAAYVAAAQERDRLLVSGDLKDLVKPGLAITAADALSVM